MIPPLAVRFTLMAALLLPMGCATVPGNAPEPKTASAAPLLTRFHLTGRLAADDGEHRFATAFSWSHTPSRAELSLFSPTGQTLARLTLEDGNATLLTAEGERHETDAATLLEPLLGFAPPPLTALTTWVQGDPGPAPDRLERDRDGRPRRVWHSGWIVTFDSWQDARPRRLTIERGAARLVLLIDGWSPEP